MRVLWLKTELLHPLDKGGRLRTYHTLKYLKQCHEVHYLALCDSPEAGSTEPASEYCTTLELVRHRVPARRSPRFWAGAAVNVLSSFPYAVARYRSDVMRERVRMLVAQGGVDLIVSDFLAPSQNVPEGIGSPAILFEHNVEAKIWLRHAQQAEHWLRRKYLERQWRLMRRLEQRECGRFDQVIAVSEEDAATIRSDYGVENVAWVPTGVDTESFRPSPTHSRNARELLFTGSLDWLPNEDAIVHFVTEILPRVQQEVPDVLFTIVGRRPSGRIRRLTVGNRAIRLVPDVPDVRPYLEAAGVFVVPLRIGGGTRLKIFEAMAMELPVVSTAVGAEGLPVEADVHLEVGDSVDDFAARVVRLLRDPTYARTLATRAAALVRQRHDWRRAGAVFTRLCEEVVERRRSAGQPANGKRA